MMTNEELEFFLFGPAGAGAPNTADSVIECPALEVEDRYTTGIATEGEETRGDDRTGIESATLAMVEVAPLASDVSGRPVSRGLAALPPSAPLQEDDRQYLEDRELEHFK